MLDNQYLLGFNSRMSKYRAFFIRDFCGRGKINSILDLGAGTGDVIFDLTRYSQMVKKAKKVVLVDFNKKYIKQSQQKLKEKKFEFILSKVENLKLNYQFDLIIAIDILEHIDNPLIFLKKIKKFLTKKGKLLIIVPNAKSIHRLVGKEMELMKTFYDLSSTDKKIGHKRYFDSKILDKIVAKAGFSKIRVGGILLKIFPNNEMNKLSNEYLDALYQVGKIFPEYCAELAFFLKKK